MTALRRPGGRWLLRVHHWAGRVTGEREGGYDTSHTVTCDPAFGGTVPDSDTHRTHVLEGCEFDELVVGRFLHVEQMDIGTWWINIGGVTVHVTADRDGKPKRVWVAGPDDYDERKPGCKYQLTWGVRQEEHGD